MTRACRLTVLAAVLAAAGVAIAVAATRDAGPQPSAASASARFLAEYVDGDGRVVRRDQGGDSVSEGQAYAMLIAAGTGREARFDRIWGWTRAHLRRSDGLLAWRWAGGRVADPEPAADADLDAARALLVAARRFRRQDLRRDGLALARAIVAHETVSPAGAPVLVAGPWARRAGVVNPSYLSPRAFAEIGRAGTSPVWRNLERSSLGLLDGLTRRPPHLAPDWARLTGERATPTGPPDRGGAPVHGWDAVRVNLRLAESCEPAARRVAARAWPALRGHRAAAVRSLEGRPHGASEHPTALIDAAAAAHAARNQKAAGALLDRAQAIDRARPTYYGAALTALARVALETDGLGRC